MKSGGILSTPNPKAGHGLCEDLKVLVQKFYESDEMSRMMPGKKNVVSIKVDEKRISVNFRKFKRSLPGVQNQFMM